MQQSALAVGNDEQCLRRDMKFIPGVLYRATVVAEWQLSQLSRELPETETVEN